ncbi:MAG: carboxymuconolactone decarboxylase family protein [Alphaproteobacteria bacterium]|nr:carboxymuconolactone decarboxylase family protein [Alphaproteobacteria bacterium]MDE2336368.1 carboxymuconolactone decarboxylase family protein [Alphaproteobacteria bacterium]
MTNFDVYTPATAPEKSRPLLGLWQEKMGFVPNAVGIMAESPALLKGFAEMRDAYEKGLFSPVERAVIHMTVSGLNGSAYCIAAKSACCEKSGIPKDVVDALREERPMKDPKLEALRAFIMSVMKKMGRTDQRDLDAFYKAGYSKAHVMEAILGVSLGTIGNYVSHIARPQLDKPFEPHRIDLGKKKPDARSSHAA